MQKLVGERQSGKTTEAIKLADKKQLYIICPTRQQVQFVAKLAHEMGANIPFPLTWQEFIEHDYYGRNINGFIIDNIDQCIQLETNVPIELITLTGSDPKPIREMNDGK